MLIALLVAAVLSLAASVTSGIVYTAHSSPGQECQAPCIWHEYGWPYEWRSDAPTQYLQATEDTHSIWNHDENGIAWMWMYWNAFVWFAVLGPLALATTWLGVRTKRLATR